MWAFVLASELGLGRQISDLHTCTKTQHIKGSKKGTTRLVYLVMVDLRSVMVYLCDELLRSAMAGELAMAMVV